MHCTRPLAFLLMASIGCRSQQHQPVTSEADSLKTSKGITVDLPAPYATQSAQKLSRVTGWPAGKQPVAPEGFTVTKFADGLNNPRWIYVAPNGDIFVAQASTANSTVKALGARIKGSASNADDLVKSPNTVLLLRDADHDGVAEQKQVFLSGLNQPFGMLILNNTFYVANTDGIMAYPYQAGQTEMKAAGKKILDLPAGGYNNHWTRNLMASADGKKIFVTVGSGSNVGEHGIEHEKRRADILEINPDGTGERVYASGLRNPQGMGFAPGTTTLWTAVNERDELGDELVPDFLTSVKDGGFYGWPYAYWGQHVDPRMKDQQPDLVKRSIVPDVPMGAHTASLGLAFDEAGIMPGKYRGGAFVGQHGSWNRSSFSGYQVAFVPFRNGRPTGGMETFLGGFIADAARNKVYGRPVGVAFTKDCLLVADDAANTIWCVRPKK